MFRNNNKNLILFIIFSTILFGVFLNKQNIKKPVFKHNSLNTDYAKVVITWTPPNNAPTFSTDPYEDPVSRAVCAEILASPTNVGDNVTFKAAAIDGDGDDYYLAVCKTNSITPNNNATPTCTGGEWCYSNKTTSASPTSCSTTTVDSLDITNDWYAFVCDYHGTDSKCSVVNQGDQETCEGTGSPFVVNHRPTVDLSGWTPPTANPGGNLAFGANTTDQDSNTKSMYICKTNNTSGVGCEANQEICNNASCGATCQCTGTADIPSEGNIPYYVFVFDQYNLRSASSATANYTVSNVLPTITSIALNGGSDIDLSSGGEGTAGNTNINATAVITDNNGCDDVQSVKALKTYPTGVGAGSCLSQDDNSCYYDVSCTGGSCTSGITKTYTCAINFKFNVDPTDTGTPREAETWKTTIAANDESTPESAELSTGVELLSYTSLNVDNSINYGKLGIGEMTNGTALSTTTKVYSSGNTGIDVQLSGTNMTGAGTIAVGQQKYATSGVAYSSANALTTSAVELEINCKKPTTTSALPFKTVYWGLQIPAGASAGSYSGTNTFTAVKAETGDW